MTILMVGMHDSVLTLESSKSGWNSRESLKGTNPQSIAFDPLNSGRAYCATFGNSLWRTDDNGQTGITLERILFPAHTLCLLQLVL
jgi:hypothetical protein